jgi:hypothetical protein
MSMDFFPHIEEYDKNYADFVQYELKADLQGRN